MSLYCHLEVTSVFPLLSVDRCVQIESWRTDTFVRMSYIHSRTKKIDYVNVGLEKPSFQTTVFFFLFPSFLMQLKHWKGCYQYYTYCLCFKPLWHWFFMTDWLWRGDSKAAFSGFRETPGNIGRNRWSYWSRTTCYFASVVSFQAINLLCFRLLIKVRWVGNIVTFF
jgi:hypothetical protein